MERPVAYESKPAALVNTDRLAGVMIPIDYCKISETRSTAADRQSPSAYEKIYRSMLTMQYEDRFSFHEVILGSFIAVAVLFGVPYIVHQKNTDWITISEIYVKKGDSVNQDDVLFDYRFHADAKEDARQMLSPTDGKV